MKGRNRSVNSMLGDFDPFFMDDQAFDHVECGRAYAGHFPLVHPLILCYGYDAGYEERRSIG